MLEHIFNFVEMEIVVRHLEWPDYLFKVTWDYKAMEVSFADASGKFFCGIASHSNSILKFCAALLNS